jgi:hypothetical protein
MKKKIIITQDTIDKYIAYVIAMCGIIVATLIMCATAKADYDIAIELAMMTFVIGPALGFLVENIVNFIKEKT